ncbi:MAG: DUF5069 domain-containing protein [Nitrospira sp.]|nr:DUF5069 domain-containing protein [Nitrospira sp.]
MTQSMYPRSPKVLLGGIAHLGRLIDKIRLRHAGKIQDYNYLTVGFDQYLIDFLGIDAQAFEQRVLAGGTDDDLLAWVQSNGRPSTPDRVEQWSRLLLAAKPKDEEANKRYQSRLQDIASKRCVPMSALPAVTTWADAIDLDEERM